MKGRKNWDLVSKLIVAILCKKVGNVILLTDFANCDVLQHIENESELPKKYTANIIIMVEYNL